MDNELSTKNEERDFIRSHKNNYRIKSKLWYAALSIGLAIAMITGSSAQVSAIDGDPEVGQTGDDLALALEFSPEPTEEANEMRVANRWTLAFDQDNILRYQHDRTTAAREVLRAMDRMRAAALRGLRIDINNRATARAIMEALRLFAQQTAQVPEGTWGMARNAANHIAPPDCENPETTTESEEPDDSTESQDLDEVVTSIQNSIPARLCFWIILAGAGPMIPSVLQLAGVESVTIAEVAIGWAVFAVTATFLWDTFFRRYLDEVGGRQTARLAAVEDALRRLEEAARRRAVERGDDNINPEDQPLLVRSAAVQLANQTENFGTELEARNVPPEGVQHEFDRLHGEVEPGDELVDNNGPACFTSVGSCERP